MVKRLTIILLLFGHCALAQEQDSAYISLKDFYAIILNNHPVVKQALLLDRFAKQEIRMARGAFDPKFSTSRDFKSFKGTEYWDIRDSELKIPTWFNADLKLSYKKATGSYLDSEYINAEQGLSSAGVSLPIGQGLFTDSRRAALQEAKLMTTLNEAERISLINKTLLKANKDYWDWYFTYGEYQIEVEGYQLASFRLQGIKQSVVAGAEAAIDSVEARILEQSRFIDREMARTAYLNATLQLSNYFWTEDQEPAFLPNNVVPNEIPTLDHLESEIDFLVSYARENHPDLRKVSAKLGQGLIQRKLAIENLKPVLNLDYNFLFNETNPSFETPFLFENNYKFGLDFQIPLLLRKERAKLGLTKLKITDLELELAEKRLKVINEVNTSYNNLTNLATVLNTQEEMTDNYLRLLQGELMKFDNGESSLFLVNTRESKYLESRSKLLKLKVTYEKEKFYLHWAAGNINPVIEEQSSR
jgi:outer membrane protein TolC